MLVLKLTDKNRHSHGGFQWPESGSVSCTDWDPRPRCGGGLHGWANGCGAYRHSFNEGCWLVVDVSDSAVVPIDGGEKVKFPAGVVIYAGDRVGAVKLLIERGALTVASDPAYACFTRTQLTELAMRSADRAVRRHAPRWLQARGMVEAAERLRNLPKIVDQRTARAASADAADAYAAAAAAAAYAAYAADAYADTYAAAADAAAAAAAYAADAADAYADTYAAADAAAAAAAYAADAYAAAAAEREAHRQDKLQLLGIVS